MKSISLMVALLMASPAFAQSKPKAAAVVDPCAPIGRTADGRFVYSLRCETLPATVAPQQRAAGSAASVAAEPTPAIEEDKGGLFRNPFPSLIKPSNSEQMSGVGPPPGGR
jgi:hypothetical protein